MALSFLYVAFVRILRLRQLSRRDKTDLAIEVVILRHEVRCCAARCRARLCDQRIGLCSPG
jgi:hypothetical protein